MPRRVNPLWILLLPLGFSTYAFWAWRILRGRSVFAVLHNAWATNLESIPACVLSAEAAFALGVIVPGLVAARGFARVDGAGLRWSRFFAVSAGLAGLCAAAAVGLAYRSDFPWAGMAAQRADYVATWLPRAAAAALGGAWLAALPLLAALFALVGRARAGALRHPPAYVRLLALFASVPAPALLLMTRQPMHVPAGWVVASGVQLALVLAILVWEAAGLADRLFSAPAARSPAASRPPAPPPDPASRGSA